MSTKSCALVDSHCHPHFAPLGENLPAVLAAMEQNGVGRALAVATERAEIPAVVELTERHAGVFYAACGIHPTTDEEASEGEIVEFCAPAGVLAVGETGLDFYRDEVGEEAQRRRFAAHIAAAKRLRKPLVIHTRDSLPQTLDMLAAEGAGEVGGVLHCFGGGIDEARRALDLNFYLSFTGIVSFKSAGAMRETAAFVPANRYMAETDAPYLAPVPHRGKTNTPAFVLHVAEALAAARKSPLRQVAEETTQNFERLFAPPAPAAQK